MSTNQAKTVAVFIPVDDENWRSLALNLADIRRSRDVRPHVVILDRTESGIGAVEDASVITVGPEVSLGDAIHTGLKSSPAELIALSIPGVRMLPNRLVCQRADLSINRHIDMVTSNLVLVDTAGCLVAEADPEKSDEAPTPFWQAGVMIRRAALSRIGRSSDLPVELFLYFKLRSSGRTGHMSQVFSVVEEDEFNAAIEGSLEDALAIRRISPPIAPRSDRWVAERVSFDERLTSSSSVTDALDRMIREGTFDR
jgi:hypothetical protein